MTDYYTDLMVISCDQSFSESTSINEILIRAKKASNADFRPKPMFMVTLKRRPKDFVEAHVLSKSILDLEESGKELGDIFIGEEKMGSFYVSYQSGGKPWPASGHGVEIKKIAEKLASGSLLFPEMTKETPLEDVKPLGNHENLQVGPTHHLIGYLENVQPVGAFLLKKAFPGDKLNLSMWRTDSHNQNSVFCMPTHRGVPRSGMEDEADRMLETTRSTLFLSRCFGMASQPLLASMTREKCLGGRAHTALICSPEIAPVYWMWFNSIFGLAVHWHQGSKTQIGRILMGVRDIQKVPCPDFSKNTAKYFRMREIADKYVDNFGDKTLMPAAFAWIDPVRHEIDDAVAEMLEMGLSPEDLQSMREMWCRERSVHRGATEVVRKLEESNLMAT